MELRKSNFEGPQSQFRNFFLVRNSAIDLVVCNIAGLRRCGLKLRMPTFGKRPHLCSSLWFMSITSVNILFISMSISLFCQSISMPMSVFNVVSIFMFMFISTESLIFVLVSFFIVVFMFMFMFMFFSCQLFCML